MKNQFTPTIEHISALVKVEKLSNSLSFLDNLANTISKDLKLTIVKKINNKFKPVGRTLIYILSESHLAIHTWPEYNLIHFDLLSCKKISHTQFDSVLTKILKTLKILKYKSRKHQT